MDSESSVLSASESHMVCIVIKLAAGVMLLMGLTCNNKKKNLAFRSFK